MGTEYPCREPGCGETFRRGDTEANRRDRSRHEQREHLDSIHRAWPCPRDCGPLGNLYEEDALKAHVRKAHSITGSDIDQLWPYVMEERARRLDVIWKQAETDGDMPQENGDPAAVEAEETPDTAHRTRRPDQVYQELQGLLRDWQTQQDDLDAAEAEINAKDAQLEEMAMEMAALRGENKTLREGLTVVSGCVASVLVQVGGDGALESEPA